MIGQVFSIFVWAESGVEERVEAAETIGEVVGEFSGEAHFGVEVIAGALGELFGVLVAEAGVLVAELGVAVDVTDVLADVLGIEVAFADVLAAELPPQLRQDEEVHSKRQPGYVVTVLDTEFVKY